MEAKIKVNRILSWIMMGIASLIFIISWSNIIAGFAKGGYEGVGSLLLCFVAIPGTLSIVGSIVLLIVSGKIKNPHQVLYLGEMLTSIIGFECSYLFLYLLISGKHKELANLAEIPFLLVIVVKLIISILAIVTAKRLRHQAKAQKQFVQPVQQYQQPMQPVQPVQQYQQPVQPQQ